ncbi:hypothetical protein HK405_004374 [Cladochytrium tenue]|nr:hypothetical protein HK405_004374 [Cladochytrium tenue]
MSAGGSRNLKAWAAVAVSAALVLVGTLATLLWQWDSGGALAPQPAAPGRRRRPSAGCAVAILTVAYGDAWYFPASLANKQAYADRHGYCLVVLDDPVRDAPPALAAAAAAGDPTPHAVWSKVSGLRRYLCAHEWIWLLDADAFVANPAVRVEEFVVAVEALHLARGPDSSSGGGDGSGPDRAAVGPPPPAILDFPTVSDSERLGPDLILGMDCNGINAGSMFVRGAAGSQRRCNGGDDDGSEICRAGGGDSDEASDGRPWVLRFVEFWLAMEPMPEVHRVGLMEQSALARAIEANVLDARRRVAAVPLRALNSYAPAFDVDCHAKEDPYGQTYRPGDWVIHFVHTSKSSMNETLTEMGLLP